MAVRDDFAAGEVLAAADLNDTFASKVDYATPTNAQSGTAYTFVADDAERITTASNGSAVTFTIPPQSSVGWVDDTILRVVNYGAGALTVAGGSGVTVTNTATVINQYGGGAAIRTGSDAWTFVPFGAGSEPINVTGGNEVGTVGGYRYHLFTGSSSLVITSPATLECEIAVIGAGGGGGYLGGGGGGAKEPASGYTTQTLSAGSYTVTIASGGSGTTSANARGGTPSATSFAGSSTISANGGGGGGGNTDDANNQKGGPGGSGGGGGTGQFTAGTGGAASGSNTNAGGTGNISPSAGGGGGGATATGGNANGSAGGTGGAGLTLTNLDANLTSANFTTFSGMTVISSGGGGGRASSGGGAGGTGAGSGGSGAIGGNATSFGSGGGGGGNVAAGGGNGYAGLVIVRYAV